MLRSLVALAVAADLDVTAIHVHHGTRDDADAEADVLAALEQLPAALARKAERGRLRNSEAIASALGHAPVVKLLLASGAAVDQTDVDGRTAVFLASLFGVVAVVAVLIAAGANVDLADKNGALLGSSRLTKH